MLRGTWGSRSGWLSAVLWQVPPANSLLRAGADEIDAIGKARGAGGGDAGTQEREQGLMQMLYEMDGFESNKGVLVVGATNRVTLLDDALLRKGRFDMTIYMGRPSTNNRFKILQVRTALWHSHCLAVHPPCMPFYRCSLSQMAQVERLRAA